MRGITWLMAAVLLASSAAASAAEPAAGDFWTTPAIAGFGRMHPLPQAAYKPDPARTYRIVFSLSKAGQKPEEVSPSLDRVARTVNLYVASGVPLSHLKFVAVASGDATGIVLDDAHYKTTFGVSNPNLPLIAALRHAGVDVAVCGQAVAEHKFEYEWVDSSVTVALSALTTITTLEERGYLLMPL
jgi:intracellular sulfur oxidation DsrE/DsrF family protein